MAISTSLTWTVLNVDRDLSDGFIYNANYKITGICTETVSGVPTSYGPVETEGTTTFSTARTGSEIPYDDVTEANVVTWIKTSPQMNATTVIGQDQPDPNTQISWFPDKDGEEDEEKGQRFDLFHSSGVTDGYLTFYGGTSSQRDGMILRDPGKHIVKPVVGTIYIFPSWLEHGVNPFRGPGERRTVATNLNVWDVGDLKHANANMQTLGI